MISSLDSQPTNRTAMPLHMSAARVVRVLAATAVLSVIVLFGYLRFVSEDLHPFAEFALVKRIIVPVMYCLFAVSLIWPLRGVQNRTRLHVPFWWWLFLAASAASLALSIVYRPRQVELLDFLQGLALFGGALVVAFAGLLSADWPDRHQRHLFLFLALISVLAIANLSTGLVPFIDVLIPTIAAALFLATRARRYRVHLALFSLLLCVGLLVVISLGPADASIAVLAQVGTSLALLVAWCVPYLWRRPLVIGGVVLAALGAVVSNLLPMFVGNSSYRDVTIAQRGYETAAVMEAVFASPWTALFGLGPAGVVDLSSSPDATTLGDAGRVTSAVESVHLLTSHMLLKAGSLGLVAIIVIALAMGRQVWIAVSQREVDTLDGILLFYAIAGLAAAVPAATNLFVNPLPLLFLGILSSRHRGVHPTVTFRPAWEWTAGALQRWKARSRGLG